MDDWLSPGVSPSLPPWRETGDTVAVKMPSVHWMAVRGAAAETAEEGSSGSILLEHDPQTSRPQWRQWCRLCSHVKAAAQCEHWVAAASGCQSARLIIIGAAIILSATGGGSNYGDVVNDAVHVNTDSF
eukprot:gene326-biopygen300